MPPVPQYLISTINRLIHSGAKLGLISFWVVVCWTGCQKRVNPPASESPPSPSESTENQSHFEESLKVWLPQETELIVQIQPDKLLSSSFFESLTSGIYYFRDRQITDEMFESFLGFRLSQIERITFASTALSERVDQIVYPQDLSVLADETVLLIELDDEASVTTEKIKRAWASHEFAGRRCYQLPGSNPADAQWIISPISNTMFLAGQQAPIHRSLEQNKPRLPENKISFADFSGGLTIVLCPNDLRSVRTQSLPNTDRQYALVLADQLRRYTDRSSLQIELNEGLHFRIRFHCTSEEAAQRIEKATQDAIVEAQRTLEPETKQFSLLAKEIEAFANHLLVSRDDQVVQVDSNLDSSQMYAISNLAHLLPLACGLTLSAGQTQEVHLQPTEPQSVSGLPDGLKLNATVTSRAPTFRGDAATTVQLRLSGHSVHKIAAAGVLRIQERTTKHGPLRLADTSTMKSLVENSSPSYFLENSTPEEGESVIPLEFQAQPHPLKMIKSLKGELQIVLAGTSRSESIDDLVHQAKSDAQRASADNQSKSTVLQLPPAFPGDKPSLAIVFPANQIIASPRCVDAQSGKPLSVLTEIGKLPDGRTRILLADGGPDFPEEIKLKYQVLSDLQQHSVTFLFEDLKVPTTPQRPLGLPELPATQSVPSETPAPAADQFIEASAEWSSLQGIDANGDMIAPPLEAHVDLIGPSMTNCIALGQVDIETAIASGEELSLSPTSASDIERLQREMLFYDPLTLTPPIPVDGARLSIPFHASPKTKSITELKGTFTVVYADQQKQLVIENLTPGTDKLIEHPLLAKSKIQLQPVIEGDEIRILVQEPRPFMVSEIVALDASGGDSLTIYSGRQQFGERTVFSFISQEVRPQQISLRITVNTALQESVVPFNFRNIPVVRPMPNPFPLIEQSLDSNPL